MNEKKKEKMKTEESGKENDSEMRKEDMDPNRQYVYIGDDLGYEVRRDTVFIGGMPEVLQEKLGKYPEIRLLFVPMEELIEKKKRLYKEGTPEYLANKALKEAR